MPLRTVKRDTADTLSLEWILHVQNYRLILDKKRCVGCQICSLACPKEAIKVEKQPKTQGQKTKKAKVDIDLAKCNFCAICDVLCPYGAIRVTSNGKHILSVVEKGSFPELIRDISVNADKCPTDLNQYADVCPLGLIKATVLASDERQVENVQALNEKAGPKVKVDVEKEYCPCCGVCEVKLPHGAIHVRRFLSGKISIHQEKCPEGCTDCLDVCPITGALYLSDGGKVNANETFCVFCGACKTVCPIDEALEFKRTHVSHTPVRSGAWNKALERLTSPVEMIKELKTKGSLRARESVKKRVGLRVEQYA